MTTKKNSKKPLAKQIRQMLNLPPTSPKKGKVKPAWLRFTEETNALDYLDKAVFYIRETPKTPTAWKWVILGLHGALYGFAISACRGTDAHSVSTPTKKGDRHLISFPEAIKRCQDASCMRMTVTSRWLQPTKEQTEAVKKLHQTFRNNFLHYKPMAWLIELHGQPNLALHVLDVIRFLALETGNYVHLTTSQRKKVKSLVFQGKRLLKQSPLHLKPEKTT
jgi:hypothetical protein